MSPFVPKKQVDFPTPRPPVEIVGGDGNDVLDGKAKVITANGEDKTEEFLIGAKHALALAQFTRYNLCYPQVQIVHLVGATKSMMGHLLGNLPLVTGSQQHY